MQQAKPDPIRFTLRTYSPEELAALNRELGREGPAAFRPAEEVLARIAAQKYSLGADRAILCHHPDERVQMALLQRDDLTPDSGYALSSIWATAYAYACSEGVVWTPVLDYLVAGRQYWPEEYGKHIFKSSDFIACVPERVRAGLLYRRVEEQAGLLADWLRADPENRLEMLLRLHADAFVGSVLVSVRGISPVLFRDALERRPSIGPAVAQRARALPTSCQRVLKDWALNGLPGRADSGATPNSPHIRDTHRTHLLLTTLYNSYAWGKLEVPLSEDDANRLLAFLEGAEIPFADSPLRTAVLVLAVCAEHLNEAALLKLIPLLRSDQEIAAMIRRARRATPRVWKACLDRADTDLVQEAIASTPEAVRSPEIRSLLLNSENVLVWLSLLNGASDEEFIALFRKAVRRDLDTALLILEDYPDRAALLEKSDLMPLLESSFPAHRLAAITLLGSLETGAVRPARHAPDGSLAGDDAGRTKNPHRLKRC